jgi:hypothetical protein
MDRASAFEAEGCRFEPCRARHLRVGGSVPAKEEQFILSQDEHETSSGRRRLSRNEEAAMGFKLDPREIGWAPYVMIGGGFGLGMLVLAVAIFLMHA